MWISKGYPSHPSRGWNKAQPKKSLYDIGMAHTVYFKTFSFINT